MKKYLKVAVMLSLIFNLTQPQKAQAADIADILSDNGLQWVALGFLVIKDIYESSSKECWGRIGRKLARGCAALKNKCAPKCCKGCKTCRPIPVSKMTSHIPTLLDPTLIEFIKMMGQNIHRKVEAYNAEIGKFGTLASESLPESTDKHRFTYTFPTGTSYEFSPLSLADLRATLEQTQEGELQDIINITSFREFSEAVYTSVEDSEEVKDFLREKIKTRTGWITRIKQLFLSKTVQLKRRKDKDTYTNYWFFGRMEPSRRNKDESYFRSLYLITETISTVSTADFFETYRTEAAESLNSSMNPLHHVDGDELDTITRLTDTASTLSGASNKDARAFSPSPDEAPTLDMDAPPVHSATATPYSPVGSTMDIHRRQDTPRVADDFRATLLAQQYGVRWRRSAQQTSSSTTSRKSTRLFRAPELAVGDSLQPRSFADDDAVRIDVSDSPLPANAPGRRHSSSPHADERFDQV